MNKEKKSAGELEALLFVYGEPLEIKRAANILGTSEEEILGLVEQLVSEYASDNRGLFLLRNEDKIQLATKPELSKILSRLVEEEFEEDLTAAATETLSIIAYAGPISRAQIEYIRGVNSSFILRSLLMRGLINRTYDSKRQNIYLYSISFDMLKKLGLDSAAKLPDYEKYRGLIEQFFARQNETQ